MGIGTTLIALSNNPLSCHVRLAKARQYTLGIYVIHFVFIDNLSWIEKFIVGPLGEAVYTLSILLFSIAASIILAKKRIDI
jgi:surface polysaccharide O-acyltransferase-like enzyme